MKNRDQATTDALEQAFLDWWAENDHALRNAHPGEVWDLFDRLNAARENARKSSFETSSAIFEAQ